MESHIGISQLSIWTVRSSSKRNPCCPSPHRYRQKASPHHSSFPHYFLPLPTLFELCGILRPPISMASLLRHRLPTPGIVSFSLRCRPRNHCFGEQCSIPRAADGSASVAGCSPWVLKAAKLGVPMLPLRASSNLYSAVEEGSRVLEEEEEPGRPLRVGIICGGPSAERGISLNSARSVLDHIQVCCFLDHWKKNVFCLDIFIMPALCYLGMIFCRREIRRLCS